MQDFKYKAIHADDINSDYGNDSEVESKKRDLVYKDKAAAKYKGNKQEVTEEYSKEEFRKERIHILTLDAYSRHKKYINDYLHYYGGSSKDFMRDSSRDKTDFDVIKENHKFLWQDDEVAHTWELQLAKKYYDKLFKEYCIVDLSLYKHNKVAMRWRIEKEVINGKGQFSCGEKKCDERDGLKSWEANFTYIEEGVKKNALVKLRLCAACSYKLNFRHKRKEAKPSSLSSKSLKRKEASNDNSNERPNELIKIPKHEPSISETKKDSIEKEELKSEPANIWLSVEQDIGEKTRDEEFDEYFQDMFL